MARWERAGTATVGLSLALVVLLLILPPVAHGDSTSGFVITPKTPAPGATTPSQQPFIEATFADSAGTVLPDSVLLYVDGENVTGINGYNVSTSEVTYAIPKILQLDNGNHSVTVTASDSAGNHAQATWE